MTIFLAILIAIAFFVIGFLAGIITLLMILFGKNSRIRITRNNDTDDWGNHCLGDLN